jgi:hypothetical protein
MGMGIGMGKRDEEEGSSGDRKVKLQTVTDGAVERDACKRSGELRTRDESRLLSGNGKRIGEDL